MTPYEFRCATHGRFVVLAPMQDGPGRTRPCPHCGQEAQRVYTLTKQIMRPSGFRLRPGDKGFDDFRREYELGEIRDDPAPLTFTPEELARMDEMPVAVAPDPERDHRLSQLIKQHWTEDLSDDTVRRRQLEAAEMQRLIDADPSDTARRGAARGELTLETA